MTQDFWKPEPTRPEDDWVAPMLKASLIVSTIGWIVYGVFALAFDDIAVIPAAIQSWLVILGSGAIVAGAEMNTAATVVAVARKWGRGKGSALDVSAFVVSLIGSVVGGLIAFSIRQTRLGESVWRIVSLDWGPLVVGVAIAADFYAAAIELGLLKADWEQAHEEWRKEKCAFDEANGNVVLRDVRRAELEFDPSWEVATIDEVRELTASLNGARATLTEDGLLRLLWKNERRPKSPSTTKRWASRARKGIL